jgi:hypothetical protein
VWSFFSSTGISCSILSNLLIDPTDWAFLGSSGARFLLHNCTNQMSGSLPVLLKNRCVMEVIKKDLSFNSYYSVRSLSSSFFDYSEQKFVALFALVLGALVVTVEGQQDIHNNVVSTVCGRKMTLHPKLCGERALDEAFWRCATMLCLAVVVVLDFN